MKKQKLELKLRGITQKYPEFKDMKLRGQGIFCDAYGLNSNEIITDLDYIENKKYVAMVFKCEQYEDYFEDGGGNLLCARVTAFFKKKCGYKSGFKTELIDLVYPGIGESGNTLYYWNLAKISLKGSVLETTFCDKKRKEGKIYRTDFERVHYAGESGLSPFEDFGEYQKINTHKHGNVTRGGQEK